jgi:hypothetical protein
MIAFSAVVGSNSLLRAAFSRLHPRRASSASVLISQLDVRARLRLRLEGASSAMEMTVGEVFIVRLRSGNLSAAVIARLLSLATRVKRSVSMSRRQRGFNRGRGVIGGELNVDMSLRESELEISVGGGGSARKLGSQTRGGRGNVCRSSRSPHPCRTSSAPILYNCRHWEVMTARVPKREPRCASRPPR